MEGTADVDLTRGAHISGATTCVAVRWVRALRGEEAVTDVLARAGERRSVEELEDAESWSSYAQATALLEAVVAVTGRADAGRRIGEEMLNQYRGTAVADLLRSLGSAEALLESIAASGSKFSTIFTLTPSVVRPGEAVLVGTTPPGVPRHWLLCDQARGLLSTVPTLFDLAPAVVTESECQARGGTRCVYTLEWDPHDERGMTADEKRLVHLENRLEAVQQQLNQLRASASDIVSAADVDTALDLVTRRAGAAVRATQYLLAVQMPSGSGLHVHAHGMPPAEAERLAPGLGAAGPAAHRLVVDVASTSRHYGRLAAFLPRGSAFFPQERELLVAYAGYAANVLDTAWAVEEARRRGETAHALLELSRELAEVAVPAEVAQRLVVAVPRVVDCDRATVMLWSEDDERLRLVAATSPSPVLDAYLAGTGIGPGDTPALPAMLAQPEPVFLRADDPDPLLRELLEHSRSVSSVVVPIVGGGRFLGIVTVGVEDDPSRLGRTSELLERLEGLASQTATALLNAQLVAELQRQALHDPLTGLPNRRLLTDRLEQELARGRRTGGGCALLFLDVDRFKQVNDSLGHHAGDELLVEVGARLRSCVRAADTVARISGDEFAVLLPGTSDVAEAARTVDRIAAALAQPFHCGKAVFAASASIGLAVRVGGSGTGSDLLREADAAMYRVKSGTAEPALPVAQPAGRPSPLRLSTDLRAAVAGSGLTVVYQPLVDLASGLAVGAEALVRWSHPELGPLSPAEFLPLAEDNELAVDLDLLVLDQACAQLRRWVSSRPSAHVAVNVSRRTLASPRLLAAVTRHLADGVLRGCLELEVTERLLDTDPERTAALLAPLRAAGATIAVDDFGTGSSGFARLCAGSVDTLKVDRSFLAEVVDESSPAPVLRAILGMAEGLGLRVVAEGVEREEERRWLLAAGCPVAQGYLLGRPGEPARVRSRLAADLSAVRQAAPRLPVRVGARA